MGFDALGLGGQALLGDDVMADLALEGVHGVELDGLTGGAHAGDSLARDVPQLFLALGAEAGNVEHEARALAGLGLDGQAGQFLERVQDLAILADEALESLGIVGDDLDGCATVLDVDLDVAVKVSDVEQFFQVVGGEFAFFIEAGELACIVVTHDGSSMMGNGVLLRSRVPARVPGP